MTEVSPEKVRELREMTGAGIMECKKALAEANGDPQKAKENLARRGLAKAASKAGRETRQGWIGQYVHSNGKIGVLLEVFCETDFVARNERFQELIRDLSMQVAAFPALLAVRPEDLDAAVVARERAALEEQMKDKPPEVRTRFAEGKLKKFYSEVCLLEMPFVKDDSKTVREHIGSNIATIGENITIGRFVRMELGGR